MPAGTPRDVVTKVNTDLEEILKSPAMKEKILSMGGIPVYSSPKQFTAFVTAGVR